MAPQPADRPRSLGASGWRPLGRPFETAAGTDRVGDRVAATPWGKSRIVRGASRACRVDRPPTTERTVRSEPAAATNPWRGPGRRRGDESVEGTEFKKKPKVPLGDGDAGVHQRAGRRVEHVLHHGRPQARDAGEPVFCRESARRAGYAAGSMARARTIGPVVRRVQRRDGDAVASVIAHHHVPPGLGLAVRRHRARRRGGRRGRTHRGRAGLRRLGQRGLLGVYPRRRVPLLADSAVRALLRDAVRHGGRALEERTQRPEGPLLHAHSQSGGGHLRVRRVGVRRPSGNLSYPYFKKTAFRRGKNQLS